MQISTTSYCMHDEFERGELNVFTYLERVKYRYGLNTADFWCVPGKATLPTLDKAFLTRVKTALKDMDLTLVNMAVDDACIWGDTPEETEQHYKNAKNYLEAAAFLGAKTVRIDFGGRKLDMTEEQFDLTVKRYKEYCAFAYDHGFKVGPENHFGPSLAPRNQKAVLEAVDHPAYGVLLHMGRWHEEIETGDSVVMPYVMHTHFNVDGPQPHGWPFDVVVDKLDALVSSGYTGCLGIEAGYAPVEVGWQVESLRRAVSRL